MCGIVGFSWDDKHLVKQLTETLKHRGPDQQGTYTDGRISLGHTRLSIIDLSERGRQPMTNEDGSIIIVFNGEVYNFKELRQKLGHYSYRSDSDTEVIIHAYEEYGPKCVKHLNGMFAFCIYDANKQQLFFARDRFGEKPLYYVTGQKGLIFASELQTILKAQLFVPHISKRAFYDYMKFRYVPNPNTIINEIKKFPHSHSAIYDLKTKKLVLSRYWNPAAENPQSIQVKELIKDAVKARLVSDVPLGVFLSGGIDSSSIVAMMRENQPEANITTFSVGFEDWQFNETQHAAKIADHFNTNHHEFVVKSDIAAELPTIIKHADEPLADPAIIPVYYLAKEAKKHATVVLTGDGADEAFCGYDQMRFLYYIQKLKTFPKPIRATVPFVVSKLPYALLNKVYQFSKHTGPQMLARLKTAMLAEGVTRSHEAIFCTFSDTELQNISTKIEIPKDRNEQLDAKYFTSNHDLLAQIQAYDLGSYLPDDLLMKADKMCMAHAVEARSPYLDHRIIAYGLHLPPREKIQLNNTKIILKKTFKNILPQNTVSRKKQPFQVPIHSWLKGDLAPLATPSALAQYGFFQQQEIERILEKLETSPLYYGRQLWSMMCFNLWYENVFLK